MRVNRNSNNSQEIRKVGCDRVLGVWGYSLQAIPPVGVDLLYSLDPSMALAGLPPGLQAEVELLLLNVPSVASAGGIVRVNATEGMFDLDFAGGVARGVYVFAPSQGQKHLARLAPCPRARTLATPASSMQGSFVRVG
jgi:hypothetical protein